MRIKGKNQHVIPNSTGWCVVDEASQMVVQHFTSQEEALIYARKCASDSEGEVLVHTSPCEDLHFISTVTLPQREFFPGQGYVDMNSSTVITETTTTTRKTIIEQQPDKPPTRNTAPAGGEKPSKDESPQDYYYDL